MLEEDMHCFPKRVIEDLDQFLVDERVSELVHRQCIGALSPGRAKVIAPRRTARIERGPTLRDRLQVDRSP